MSKEQDRVFFKNFSLIVGALAAMMVIFFIAAQITGDVDSADSERNTQTVAELTAPVGQVTVEGEETKAAEETPQVADSGAVDGEKIYNNMCVACHGVEGIGAPVLGNVEAWAPRISQGNDVLYDHAINGFTGAGGFMMPPRGGGNFSDDEVKAAVDHMVSNSK